MPKNRSVSSIDSIPLHLAIEGHIYEYHGLIQCADSPLNNGHDHYSAVMLRNNNRNELFDDSSKHAQNFSRKRVINMRLLMFLKTGEEIEKVKSPTSSTVPTDPGENVESKPSRLQILSNGNLLNAIEISSRKKARFDNTCAFDAVAQIIAAGLQDFPSYAYALQNSKNTLVNVAKQLTNR